MVESWWAAHELEYTIGAVVLGLSAVWWLVESLSDAVAERRKKKRDGLL